MRVASRGSLPDLRVGVSSQSGEILWPANVFFAASYGPSQRQFLKVLDKSENPIRSLYKEITGADAPPRLAVSCYMLKIVFYLFT